MVVYEVRTLESLTPKVRKWILAFAASDGTFDAAKRTLVECGYKDNRRLASKARSMMREHRTLINQQVRLRMQDTSRVQLALHVVEELAKEEDVPAAVRLNAAKDILAKAGLEEAKNINVNTDASDLSDKALIAEIVELSEELKLGQDEQ